MKHEDIDDVPPVADADNDDGGADDDRQGVLAPPPSRWWRTKGGKWALGSVAAIVLIAAGLLIFWPDDSKVEEPPHTENALCDADSCDGTPIRFVDLDLGSDELIATLVDPSGAEVQRVDPPVATSDSTAEWTWDASLEDPIGEYTVHFTSGTTETVGHTFTVDPVTGPFGVVQTNSRRDQGSGLGPGGYARQANCG